MTAWNYAFTQYEDYKGLVDELRFWGRALSPAEIERHAKGGLAASATGLLARYSFDEGTGSSAAATPAPQAPLRLHRMNSDNWSAEDAPGDGKQASRAVSR
jgi:hypothetical protein